MTEANQNVTSVAATEATALTVVDKDVMAALRENSGETSGESMPFVPIYQVDNNKEKTKLPDGRDVDALCPPRWKIVTKVNDEYISTPITSFTGVLLKIMWEVFNNGKWDAPSKSWIPNDAPYFKSGLFKPEKLFSTSDITIDLGDGHFESLTYKQIKEKYKDNFELVGWAFVLLNDTVVRLKLKGASRSPLFDYPQKFKKDDSFSAHHTVFSAEYCNIPQPHNKAVFTLSDDKTLPYDVNQVLAMQTELNKMYDVKKPAQAPVLTEETKAIADVMDGEIVTPDEVDFE